MASAPAPVASFDRFPPDLLRHFVNRYVAPPNTDLDAKMPLELLTLQFCCKKLHAVIAESACVANYRNLIVTITQNYFISFAYLELEGKRKICHRHINAQHSMSVRLCVTR